MFSSAEFLKIKHYAQVFLGPNLVGRPFEGSNLEVTIPELQEFLMWVRDNQPRDNEERLIATLAKKGFRSTTQQDLLALLESLREVHNLGAELTTIARSFKNASNVVAVVENELSVCLKKIVARILNKALSKGEVFFPGGWVGTPTKPGHQMIYRLTIDQKKGEAVFYIFNTGAGLQYQGSIVRSSGKQEFYPIYAFAFPWIEEDKLKCSEWLMQLLQPQIVPLVNVEQSYTATEIYEKLIIPAIPWFNGKRIPGEKLAKPRLPQRSGICVYKVLLEMFQSHFKDATGKPDEVTYRQFLLAYRLYLLKKNVDSQKLQLVDKALPGYRELLNDSLANTTRMLDGSLKEEIKLDNNERQSIYGAFIRWNKVLSGDLSLPKQNVRVMTEDSYRYKPVLLQLSATGFPDEITVKELVPAQDSTKEKGEPFYQPTLLSFPEALKELNQLAVSEQLFCYFVERFCCAFVDAKRSLLILEDNQDALLASLDKLLKRYQQCRPDLTPRSAVVYLSLIYLMDRLCEEGVFHDRGLALSCVPLAADQLMSPFVRRLVANPFLTTYDPQLDVVLQHINDFYLDKAKQYPHQTQTKGSFEKQSLHYYCSLIEKAPASEKQYLQEQWIKVDSQNTEHKRLVVDKLSAGQHYCYSYLKDTNAAPAQTPVLSTVFKRQEKIENFLRHCLSSIAVKSYRTAKRGDFSSYGAKKNFNQGQKIALKVQSYVGMTELHLFFYSILFEWVQDVYHEEIFAQGGDVWLLKPDYLQRYFPLKTQAVYNALTSHYDGNPYSSQELSFNSKTSSFTKQYFVSAQARQHSEQQKTPLTALAEDDREAILLQQLRLGPRCQVILLLSELVQQPRWLVNEEFQKYIELSIFQPHVLLYALQSGGVSLTVLLERLLKQNRFNQDPAYPEKAEWFVLKLATKICGYLLMAEEEKCIVLEEPLKKELLAWQEKMLVATTARLAKPDLSLLEQRECHQLRLFPLHCGLASNFRELQKKVEDLLDSYLHLMLSPEVEQPDAVLEEERLQVLLEKSRKNIIHLKRSIGDVACLNQAAAILQKRLVSLGKGAHWTSDAKASRFPVVVLRDAQGNTMDVNLNERTIRENGVELSYLPLSLRLKPEYHECFGVVPMLAQKKAVLLGSSTLPGICYSFSFKNHAYRVLAAQQNQQVYFQKEVQGRWYTLAAPSTLMAKHLGFSQVAFTSDFPALFEQASYRVWIQTANCYFIEDLTTGEKCYEKKSGSVRKLGALEGVLWFDQQSMPSFLLRLESKKFIEGVQKADGSFYWHLPRYGLTFIAVDPANHQTSGYQTEDKQYTVEVPQQDFFGTGLILRAKDRKKEDFYVVALQPFYVQRDHQKVAKRNGLHYVWIHDFSNYVMNTALQEEPTFSKESRRGFSYEKGERYLRIPMRDGKVCPLEAADQVYVAYLYLAQNQPEEALQLLKGCQFQGAVEELERLWWLITKLPVHAKPDVNSGVLAVQMQAIYAMARITEQFPAATAVISTAPTHFSDTGFYRYYEKTRLQQFIDKLDEHIKNLYLLYHGLRNNIPQVLRLEEAQEGFILSYCQVKSHQEWHLAREEQEKKALLKIKASEPLSSPYRDVIGTCYLQRFEALSPELRFSVYTDRQEQAQVVSLNFRELNITIPTSALSALKRTNESLSPEEAMAALSLGMSLEKFMTYFPVYYTLVRSGDQKARESLSLFCQAIVTACLPEKEKNQTAKAFIIIATILWIVIKVNGKHSFPKTCSAIPQKAPNLIEDANNILSHLFNEASVHAAIVPELRVFCSVVDDQVFKVPVKPAADTMRTAPSLPIQGSAVDPLAAFLAPTYQALCVQLQRAEAVYQEARKKLIKPLETEALSNQTLAQQKKMFDRIDSELLVLQKNKLQQQIKFVEEMKDSPVDMRRLGQADASLSAEQKTVTAELATILQHRQVNVIAEVGQQQAVPSVEGLIKNYPRTTLDDYKKMGIEGHHLDLVDAAIQKFFAIHNARKRALVLIAALNENASTKTLESQKKVVAALLSRNAAGRKGRKHELLFQYIQELTLSPQQMDILTFLAETAPAQAASYVLQLIMGGGKTKVLLPLLLYLLALAGSRPMVMIPEMLLQTGFADLRTTSLACFQQDAFLFRFDRDAPADAATLRHLYESMETAFAGNYYIVTSPSAVQSLELKYPEILYYRAHPEFFPGGKETAKAQKKETEEQLLWIEKILDLWSSTTLLADEAQELFHSRRELNYGIGEAKPIDFNVVDTAVAFFSWMNTVKLSQAGKERHLLQDLLHNPNKVAEEKEMQAVIEIYIQALAEEKLTPDWVQPLLVPPLGIENLQKYLRGDKTEAKKVSKCLENFPLIKAKWVLLREELMTFAPVTLRKKLHEDYGLDWEDLSKLIAIVYRANNVPTHFVFANFLETINYTCQALYSDGVPLHFFKNVLAAWQKDARVSRNADASTVSASERMFTYLFNGEGGSLLSMDLECSALLSRLHQKFKANPLLIQQVLKDNLSSMLLDSALLRSNGQNLASIFGRIYAFSATPSNFRDFHPKLQMNLQSGLLIESQVMDYLKTQKAIVKENTAKTPIEYLENCVQENDQVRVITDRGSHLRGMVNLEAVKNLATILARLRPAIRYILFYQKDILFAWDLRKNDQQEPKMLRETTPKYIKETLEGCLPADRFTYVDQEHSLGTDLVQDQQACAVLSVDIKTRASSFLQALMRMRALGEGQKIVIIVDSLLMQKIRACGFQSPTDVDVLLTVLKDNEQLELQTDHYPSALNAITNCFRSDLLWRLRTCKNPVLRDQFFVKAEKFFIEWQCHDILALYEHRSEPVKTARLLEIYIKQQRDLWYAIVKDSFLPQEIEKAEVAITEMLDIIFKKAKKICLPEQPSQSFCLGTEVQQQKQMQLRKQLEQVIESKKKPSLLRKLDLQEKTVIQQLTQDLGHKNENIARLMARYQQGWSFDKALYATPNFLYTFANQAKDEIYSFHTQPCFFIFFELNPPDKLKACLVCREEAEILQKFIGEKKSASYWLATISGDALTPVPVLSLGLQMLKNSLLEQAAFFNGRADILISLPSFVWLKHQGEFKLHFWREVVKGPLGISNEQFKRVQSKLYEIAGLVEEWAKYPSGMSPEHWLKKVPEEVRERFQKILVCLSEVRIRIIQSPLNRLSVEQLQERLALQDALLVDQYQNALVVLSQLKAKDYSAAAILFKEKKAALSEGFLDYCFPAAPLLLNDLDNQQLMKNIQEDDTRAAWIAQLLSANASVGLASFIDLQHQLKSVADSAKRDIFFKRILVAKIKGTQNLEEIFVFVKAVAAAVPVSNTINVLHILSEDNVQEKELLLQVLTDTDFCEYVDKLMLLNKKTKKSKEEYVPLLLAFLKLWKQNTEKLKDRLQVSGIGDAILLHAGPYLQQCFDGVINDQAWEACCELMQPGISDDFMIRALYDPELQNNIEFLKTGGYIARLGALQHQPHFFKVVTALREAHCCATIVEKAALSPLICSLVLTLQEDKLVQPKVLVAILHCGADDLLLLKTRLEYLKEKMLVAIVADIPEALTTNVLWDGIKSLQEARIDDPILVKQALKDNNFSANLQYLSSYCQSYQLQLADTFTVLIEAQGDVSRIAAALHHVESIGITAYEKKQILTDQAVWKGIDLLTNAGIVDKKIVEAALYNADFRELLKVLDAVGFQGGDLQIVSSLYYAYATSLDILQKNLVYLQKIGIDLERANDCVRGLLYPARWRVLIELREANVKDAAVVAQLLFDYDFIDLLPQLKKVGLIQNALPVALLKKRKGELRYLNKLLEIGVIDKTNSSLLEDDVHWRAVNAFDGVIIEPSVIRRVLTDVFFEAAILNFFVKQGLEKKRLPVAFLIKRANDKDFTAILDYLQQQKFVDVNHLAALLRDKTWSELLFCQRNGITDNTFIERVFTDPHFSEFIQPLESLLLIFPVKDLPFKLLMQRRTKEDLLLLQELALGTFLDENRIRLLGEDLVWVAIKNLCTAIPKAEIKGFIQQAYDDVGFQLILPVLVRAGYRQDQLITLLKQRQGQFSTVSYLEQYKISDTGKRRAFTTDAAWVAVRILQQANVNDAFLLEKAISNTDFQQVLTLLQSQGFSLDSLLLRKRIDQIVLLKKLIERNIIFPANIALLLDDDVWTALENLELAKIQDNFLATMMTMNPAYRATLRLLVRQGYAQDSLRDLLVKRDVSVLSYLVQQPLDEKLKIQALIQDFAWSAVELLAKAAPYFNQELIALTEQAITDANFQFLMTLLKAQGYLGSSFPLGVVVKRKKELATLGYVRNVGSYNNSILAHLFTDDCGWTTLRALEDAKVSDSALIMLADNAVFQQVVALLLKGCRSSIDLPLALLNQCKLNSAPLKTILEHLDASGLLDPDRHPDTLSRLVDPSIQSGLQVLVGAKVTDHSLLDLALRGDPDYKAVMSYLQSIADPGFTVSLCFLQLHKKNLRQGLLMLELLQEICSLDAVHIEIACKEAEAVQALAALRQANIHDKPQIVHALHKPALVVAKLILQESGLENSFLAAAVEIDRQLKEKLEAKYNRAATGGPAHLTPWTIAVIQQINTIKQRYEANPLYANYRVSIQSFAHETLNVLLDNDGDLNRPKAQQQIVAGFRKAADKHFKHRHLALRIVSDLLLALTVAGLLVHLGRKLSGRTFFFSTAQTARQSDFEQALAKTPSCLPR